MEGRNDELEWWMLMGNHNRVVRPDGFVQVTPDAGIYTRPSPAALPQNQSVLEMNPYYKRFELENNNGFHRVNPNLVNPNFGDIGFEFNSDYLYNLEMETLFGRMSLSSSSDQFGVYGNNNSPATNSSGIDLSSPSPYVDYLNRMQVHGSARNVTINKGFEGFGDPTITSTRSNNRHNRNGFRVRSSLYNLRDNNNNINIYAPAREDYKFSSLEELRGKIVGASKDQKSCGLVQQKLEEGKLEDIEMIFSEIKNNVCELMVHQSGNYLVQKLFQVCNARQMTELLASVVRDGCQLVAICLDIHGSRAMQTMLRYLTTQEQRALVVAALTLVTVTLTKSVNGHHVIQHCVKFFSNEEKKKILKVVADNCLNIAADKSGCCVLQHCVENADVHSRERLLSQITANSLVLSEHPYGNYVVQNILGLRIPHSTSEILKQLAGSFVSLSMNKYGSNVVEKCLKETEENQAMGIIEEIVSSPNFLMVLQDAFGNYVVQSALAISKGALRHAMVSIINMHYASLHSHPHGKRVLAKTRGNNKQRLV